MGHIESRLNLVQSQQRVEEHSGKNCSKFYFKKKVHNWVVKNALSEIHTNIGMHTSYFSVAEIK